MKYVCLIALLLCATSCNQKAGDSAAAAPTSCKGEYAVKDANDVVRQRFNEFYVKGMGCVTDPVSLTTFEKQEAQRFDRRIQCVPQAMQSVTLLSRNNYYSPRNDSIWLDLNAQTGIFRRLIVGQTAAGAPLFTRDIGCWFQRSDNALESYGNREYGDQILLDLEEASSSLDLHPMEVYRYTKTGGNWDTVRFGDPTGVDWTFCPADSSPWEYCTALRNGNYMYYPDNLTAAQMAALKAEALLIRSQYNFVEISTSSFESKWASTINSAKEYGTAEAIKNNYKFKYGISGLPDVPWYIDRTIRSYLRGEYPQMPDTNSVALPLICYTGYRDVILGNGSAAKVFGEICYSNGVYTFTQQ
jgi:hypothetical protein